MRVRDMCGMILAGTAGILGAGAVGILGAAAAGAQEIPVDRWLVASAAVEAGSDPLPAFGGDRFPDRNLETESRVWTLLRRDGERRFDLAEWTVDGEATLTHAYLRATMDTDVRLALAVEACVELRAWLNGQLLPDPGRPREVRLASGWNTLLIALDGESGCDRSLSAALSRETGPNARRGRPVAEVRVQASRPPGVRPNYPEGVVTVSMPRVTSVAWNPGGEDLDVAVGYELASWGREAAEPGTAVDAPGVQRPGRPRMGPPGARPPGLPPMSPFDAPRRGGADPSGTEAGDDEGPTDPEGLRARMIAQLLGRPEPKEPAPRDGSVELRLADHSLVAAGNDLRPGSPLAFDGSLPFRRLREAALREDGVRADVRWRDGDAEGEGRMSAARVLRALHGALDLGLEAGPGGAWRGRLRVPEALAGFTVRGLAGTWSVDGAPAEGGVLCAPCGRGDWIEVEYRAPADAPDERPRTRIANPGIPDLADGAVPSALELLRALDGDNRRYLELVGG